MTSSDAKDGNMIEFWMRLISLFKDNSNCFRATVENPKLVFIIFNYSINKFWLIESATFYDKKKVKRKD